MEAAMSKVPGRLQVAGGVLFVLCGIGHTIGQYSPDAHGTEIAKRLKTFTVPGTPWNYWDVMQCWGVLYGAMTILFGVALVAVHLTSGGDPRVRRAVSLIGAIAAGVQFVFSLGYGALPPMYFMIPAGLLLVLAARWPWEGTSG
jgi:hypothetical protein